MTIGRHGMRAGVIVAGAWLLLSSGLGTTLAAAESDTRIADAVRTRNISAVADLITQKADVNGPQADGATALHWAAHWDEPGVAKQLIAAGANVNAANDYG